LPYPKLVTKKKDDNKLLLLSSFNLILPAEFRVWESSLFKGSARRAKG